MNGLFSIFKGIFKFLSRVWGAGLGWIFFLVFGLLLGGMAFQEITADRRPFARFRASRDLCPGLADLFGRTTTLEDRQALAAAADYIQRKSDVLFTNGVENLLPYRDFCRILLPLDEDERASLEARYGEVYAWAVNGGKSLGPVAGEISAGLLSAQKRGGSDWEAVKESPLYLHLYTLLHEKKPEIWTILKAERGWMESYLGSYPLDLTEGEKIDLSAVAEALVRHRILLKRFHREWERILSALGEGISSAEQEACEMLPGRFLRAFLLYPELFEEVSRRYPSLSLYDLYSVIVNNMTPDLEGRWGFLPALESNRERGKRVCRLYGYPSMWEASRQTGRILELAALIGDEQCEQLLERVRDPRSGEYPDVGLLLLDRYRDQENPRLLGNAVESLVRYPEVGAYLLNAFAGRPDFAALLGGESPGYLLVPLFIACMERGRGGTDEEVFRNLKERLEGDREGWINRLVDRKTGEPRIERENLAECLPLVGGLWGVARHWAKGEAVTLGEIGWASYDVVEILVAIGSFGTGTALTSTAKAGVKGGVKAGLKGGVKAGTKTGARSIAGSGIRRGLSIYRAGAKGRALVRIRPKLLRAIRVSKSGRVLGRASRSLGLATTRAVQRLARGRIVWRNLPPSLRRGVRLGVVGIMAMVEMHARESWERLPGGVEEAVRALTSAMVKGGFSPLRGMADGVASAVADSLGLPVRWGRIALFVPASLFFLFLFLRRVSGRKREKGSDLRAPVLRV